MVDFAHAARIISTECPCIKTRQASRALTRIYDEALRPSGLLTAQLGVLVAVARFGDGGAKITQLASALVLERTTLTRNLVPLERDGLVRVTRHADDARARVVVLTPAGRRALATAYPLWQEAQRRTRALVGGDEVEALLEKLQPVVDVVGSGV